MHCKYINRRLFNYLKGTLKVKTRRKIDEHIRICDTCRKKYNKQVEFRMLLDVLKAIPVPANFSKKIICKIKEMK